MTLPRSSGCTRTSSTLPRRNILLATWTSSGYWTMPRTRCSRASSSTSGSAPWLVSRGLGIGGLLANHRVGGSRLGSYVRDRSLGSHVRDRSLGSHVRDRSLGSHVRDRSLGSHVRDRSLGSHVRDRSLGSHVRGGSLGSHVRGGSLGSHVRGGSLGVRLGLGPALSGTGTVLGSAVRGSTVLGRGVLGGPGRPGLRPGPALLGFLGFLAGLARLGGGREGVLLVRARLGRPERAFGAGLPGELLPVPGDLEQDANRVGGLRAHREPVLRPLGVYFDERGLGLRVVLADLLDSAPVALGARIRDNDPVMGLPDFAQALQLDLDSHDCGLLPAIDAKRRTRADRGNSRRDRTDEPGRANEERASLGLAVSLTLCQTTVAD